MAKLPLEGIRVIDITVVWALPWAGLMLGDMGAEVIRVESIHHVARLTRTTVRPAMRQTVERLVKSGTGGYFMGASYPNKELGEKTWERNAMFTSLHRSKLSVTMDLTKPKGIEMFKKLVKVSDIFIENNPPKVMNNLGLDYDSLKEVNSRLIMVRAPGYGNYGPYNDYSGLGVVFESMAGHSYLRSYPDLGPASLTASYPADAAAGINTVFAALAALHYRERTGKGQWIDMAQVENFLPHLGEAFMDYTMNQRSQSTTGNRDINGAVQGVYRCQGEDQWVTITIGSDEEWQGFCRAIGNPPWTKDEKFTDPLDRLKNHDELDKLIAEWTSHHDKYEAFHLLQKEGVPSGPVMDSKDCYEDPHFKERGWPVPLTHPEIGTYLYPGPVWKMSKTPGSLRKPAPLLGEHNEYVYKEVLKVSDEEYAELEREGHIGTEFTPEAIEKAG